MPKTRPRQPPSHLAWRRGRSLAAGGARRARARRHCLTLGTLRNHGFLRNDPRRLFGVLRLTGLRTGRERQNLPRDAWCSAAFLGGLVPVFRRHPFRHRARALADRSGGRRGRRPVPSRGPERQAGQRRRHEGASVPGVLRLHPLPRYLPDHLVRHVAAHARRSAPTPTAPARCSSPSIPSAIRPAVLKDYLSNFDPHLRGLTGDQAAIKAATKAYRVYAKKVPLENGDYTMDHTAVVYLMDKDGHFVAPFNTEPDSRSGSDRTAPLSLKFSPQRHRLSRYAT